MKLPYLGKFSARIKRDLIKIIKDYRPHLNFALSRILQTRLAIYFANHLDKYHFATHQMLCTRLLVLVAKHILGKTCRRVPDRVREHKDALTKPSRFSHVAEHSKILDIVLIGLASKSSLRTILPLNASLKKP